MIFSTAYFPPILQYALQLQQNPLLIEAKEHFVKQSYRNRCEILGANGQLSLIVPLANRKNHTPTEEITISYRENWQAIHWKSICSFYRASPFFEFYEEEIQPLFFQQETQLIAYNTNIVEQLNAIIGIQQQIEYTSSYQPQQPDYRSLIHPKKKSLSPSVNFNKYLQVFESKFGFLPNLSILDLLFNVGPQSKNYLTTLDLTK